MQTYTKTLIPRARQMRREMTEPEKRMWYRCLRELPHRFRRQRPIGPYIVDFYCASLKLVIEIDGDSHATPEAEAYDAERTKYLKGLGLQVLRFSNVEVMENLEGIFAVLQSWRAPAVLKAPPSVPPIA